MRAGRRDWSASPQRAWADVPARPSLADSPPPAL